MKSDFTVDFIGIASLRCGTTWTSRCLAEHPQVYFSPRKELNFFGRNYSKGLKYYRNFFENYNCDGKIKGEFTPAYYMYDEAPERIKKHFPNVKLLACLRNPIERIISNYRYTKERDPEMEPDISRALLRRRHYVSYGLYHQNLSRFFKYFDLKNILILIYEDALKNPKKFIKNVYRFLEIDEDFTPPSLHKRINVSSKKGRVEMDKITRENLRETYKDDIKKLEKLLGRNLSFWR